MIGDSRQPNDDTQIRFFDGLMKIYNLRNLKPQQREYQEVKDEVRAREREIKFF